MNVDEVLQAVEQILLSRRLSPVERLVLRQSWSGQTYSEMAQDSAYGIPHLKEIGSRLWHELSETLGEKVTKKNLLLVLEQYRKYQKSTQVTQALQNVPSNLMANNYGSGLLTETVLEFPGGPVPLNSGLYVDRFPIEDLAYTEISQPGCIIRINAPRKMGKSSLLNRILARALTLGYKTVYLDFQEADEAVFATLDKFLRWFCANVGRQLNLNSMLDEYWDEDMGSKVSCKIYFEGYLLEQIDTPIVLALNEVNRIFEHPNIAQDFLPMLRSWHEQARLVETWQKLRLAIVHSTEIYVPLKINQSPFNIGLSIKLPPFTRVQVQELAVRYGLNWTDSSQTEQLMAMVGGHPYLVNLAFYHLHRREMTLQELLQTAPTPAGIYSDHLRSLLAMLRTEPELALALRQVVSANESVPLDTLAQSTLPSAIVVYKLESMGLIELNGNQARTTYPLYRLYFRQQLGEEKWLDTHLKQLEKEKQESQCLRDIDELTRLVKRRYFNYYLETQWQQHAREIQPLSLLVCDIDYFRFYNRAYGNLAGDATLQRIASTIRECVNHQAAIVARYGGEEFAVMLLKTDAEAAVAVAEIIRERIKALAIAHDPGFDGFPDPFLTVSIGVASTTPSSQTSVEILINAADQALQEAKRLGRDRVNSSHF